VYIVPLSFLSFFLSIFFFFFFFSDDPLSSLSCLLVLFCCRFHVHFCSFFWVFVFVFVFVLFLFFVLVLLAFSHSYTQGCHPGCPPNRCFSTPPILIFSQRKFFPNRNWGAGRFHVLGVLLFCQQEENIQGTNWRRLRVGNGDLNLNSGLDADGGLLSEREEENERRKKKKIKRQIERKKERKEQKEGKNERRHSQSA